MQSTSHRWTALALLGTLGVCGFFGMLLHNRRQETQRQHRSIDRTLVLIDQEERQCGFFGQDDAIILNTSSVSTL